MFAQSLGDVNLGEGSSNTVKGSQPLIEVPNLGL
jgi:hypothetical protein